MDMTQADYDERKQRIADGEGTDEDRRLVKHYEREQSQQDDSTPSWLLHDDPDGDSDDYDAMTAEQLRAELGHRELPISGAKSVLIERLREDDAADREAEQVD